MLGTDLAGFKQRGAEVDVILDEGVSKNPHLIDYKIPTTLDAPPIDTILLESGSGLGPFGAKGLGELPIDGPAPAVVNAIRSMGLDVTAIPAIPETIREAACASG